VLRATAQGERADGAAPVAAAADEGREDGLRRRRAWMEAADAAGEAAAAAEAADAGAAAAAAAAAPPAAPDAPPRANFFVAARRFFDVGLAIRLALLALAFGQDAHPRRAAAIAGATVAAYLWQTGLLAACVRGLAALARALGCAPRGGAGAGAAGGGGTGAAGGGGGGGGEDHAPPAGGAAAAAGPQRGPATAPPGGALLLAGRGRSRILDVVSLVAAFLVSLLPGFVIEEEIAQALAADEAAAAAAPAAAPRA
jgi:hypothetical protein